MNLDPVQRNPISMLMANKDMIRLIISNIFIVIHSEKFVIVASENFSSFGDRLIFHNRLIYVQISPIYKSSTNALNFGLKCISNRFISLYKNIYFILHQS